MREQWRAGFGEDLPFQEPAIVDESPAALAGCLSVAVENPEAFAGSEIWAVVRDVTIESAEEY